jgi:hypothetical protein
MPAATALRVDRPTPVRHMFAGSIGLYLYLDGREPSVNTRLPCPGSSQNCRRSSPSANPAKVRKHLELPTFCLPAGPSTGWDFLRSLQKGRPLRSQPAGFLMSGRVGDCNQKSSRWTPQAVVVPRRTVPWPGAARYSGRRFELQTRSFRLSPHGNTVLGRVIEGQVKFGWQNNCNRHQQPNAGRREVSYRTSDE